MPELPTFLAGRVERWFGLQSSVAAIEPLSAKFCRVCFAGDALKGRRWEPGHEIEFRVDERALRHYTPASYDPAAGRIEVIFFLHGQGPGSAWAAGLRVGQSALVMGPGNGGISLLHGDWHLFLGDETTVGGLHAMTTALAVSVPVLGAVEVLGSEEHTVTPLVLRLSVLTRRPSNGAALDAWLAEATLPPGRGAAYLLGHGQSIQRQRDVLLARGLERKQIRCRAYWADGKRGL